MTAAKRPASVGLELDDPSNETRERLQRLGLTPLGGSVSPIPAGLRIGLAVFPDSDLALKPLIREMVKRTTRTERVLTFFAKWGRTAGPFKIAWTYVKLNWKGVEYWREVADAADQGRALLDHVDTLERGARAMARAKKALSDAEDELADYPLSTEPERHLVGATEMEEVELYFNTAAKIANYALDINAELRKAIKGWDVVLSKAKKIDDFTRGAAWDAITELELRFTDQGGSFREFLVDLKDSVMSLERRARLKQYHAAHILDRWTPDWYVPPSPPE